MAVLPTSGSIDISAGVTFAQQPDLTWYINQDTGRIQGEVSGYEAVRQAVEAILNVERFRWQIYSPYSGMQWDGLIGQNPGYVYAEIQRRMADALKMDDRIRGISDFSYEHTGDSLSINVVVDTVYGQVQTTVEVTLN